VGVGYPLEAAYALRGPLPAGNWHLVGDGIVLSSADLTFDVLWRHAGTDTLLASFRHHFDPLPGAATGDATPYQADAVGEAAAAAPGDQLVLRLSAEAADAGAQNVFIPNGDGAAAHGELPSLTLPRMLTR